MRGGKGLEAAAAAGSVAGTGTTVAGKPKRERSCVACGAKAGKTELLRIVRDADGALSFDKGGRAPGRGAYVCSAACLDQAMRTRRLDRALRVSVRTEDYERIAAEIAAVVREGIE